MKQDPKERFKREEGAEKETAPMSSSSSSFPGEEESTSLDEDMDASIIEPKPRPKDKRSQAITGSTIRLIRTYKEDIAEAVRTQKASLTSIAAAEQQRRIRIPKNIAEERHIDFKKLGIISGSILLIVLGMGVIGFFTLFYEKEGTAIKQDVPSFIFVEEQKEINVTGKNSREILQALGAERSNAILPLGQIAHLYVTKTTQEQEIETTNIISTEEFLSGIRAQVSSAFLRSLDSSFMIGIHVFNQNQPFIILKSNSYEHSFAGLLEWERTLYQDLFLFMGRKADPIVGAPVNPQTGEKIILRENFEDKIIQNIDVRALLSEAGNIEFLYAFPDQQTIIITTNENTLTELITRLNSVRVF